jgi:hypothetical protein
MTISRRKFLRLSAASLSVPVLLGSTHRLALAEDLPHLDEADALASQMGYHADGSKVDAAKNPKFSADQKCANCQFLQGQDGEDWRPCQLFPGKAVSAKGWCSAWVQKQG